MASRSVSAARTAGDVIAASGTCSAPARNVPMRTTALRPRRASGPAGSSSPSVAPQAASPGRKRLPAGIVCPRLELRATDLAAAAPIRQACRMSTPGNPARIAFVCAMPMELSPLVKKLDLHKTEIDGVEVHRGTLEGREVIAIVTGMGTKLATEATERLLDTDAVDRVVVVGITGAVENETP